MSSEISKIKYVIWYDANFKRRIEAENITEAAQIARAIDEEKEFYIVPACDWKAHVDRIRVLTKSGQTFGRARNLFLQ